MLACLPASKSVAEVCAAFWPLWQLPCILFNPLNCLNKRMSKLLRGNEVANGIIDAKAYLTPLKVEQWLACPDTPLLSKETTCWSGHFRFATIGCCNQQNDAHITSAIPHRTQFAAEVPVLSLQLFLPASLYAARPAAIKLSAYSNWELSELKM